MIFGNFKKYRMKSEEINKLLTEREKQKHAQRSKAEKAVYHVGAFIGIIEDHLRSIKESFKSGREDYN